MTPAEFRTAVQAGPLLERATIHAIRTASIDTLNRWWHDLNVFWWPDDLPGTQPAHVGTIYRAFLFTRRAVGG